MIQLTCKETSRLLSQSMDRKLTLAQRATLRLHLSTCPVCPRFGAQLNSLRVAMRNFRE